jgi:hypothetical protein
VSITSDVADGGSGVRGAVRTMMLMTGVRLRDEVVVGVASWVGDSEVYWLGFVEASMGVGDATGIVWEIRLLTSVVVVGDGRVLSAI